MLASTATRLERGLPVEQSPSLSIYPFVVVSTDFIKSDRRRDEFQRAWPGLRHRRRGTHAAHSDRQRGGRHQRHELVAALADNPSRHLVLVTATPHSGKEEAFRSLLAIWTADFADLPDDLAGERNEPLRRKLWRRHFVQRRRADIRAYMDANHTVPRARRGGRDLQALRRPTSACSIAC